MAPCTASNLSTRTFDSDCIDGRSIGGKSGVGGGVVFIKFHMKRTTTKVDATMHDTIITRYASRDDFNSLTKTPLKKLLFMRRRLILLLPSDAGGARRCFCCCCKCNFVSLPSVSFDGRCRLRAGDNEEEFIADNTDRRYLRLLVSDGK